MIEMKAWFLDHSGVAVQTERHILIFDYFNNKPAKGKGEGFAKGIVVPEKLAGMPVLVFVSHRHTDHYNQVIYSWKKAVPDLRYVMANEIKPREEAARISPGEILDWEDVRITALDSTDEGVAFLVELDDVTIYHAGDLNWWRWEGETEEDNLEMGRRYREQIDRLKGRKIDLAFVPADPRQDRDFILGLDYFMRTTETKKVMPIHFWGDFSVSDRLIREETTAPYRDRILRVERRGQEFDL